jgi:hypothetical protein
MQPSCVRLRLRGCYGASWHLRTGI